jgi:GH15 family glucan-1,4-alpha-glucosidase
MTETFTDPKPASPTTMRDGYLPIAEHGVIGDLHTVALVGTEGTIDWYCCPRFDSPSVFGSILDAERGGYYRIQPAEPGWTTKQLYYPDTNVLITRFLAPSGVAEVIDFMPVASSPAMQQRHRLVRRVLGIRGDMRLRIEVERASTTHGRATRRTWTSAALSSRPRS